MNKRLESLISESRAVLDVMQNAVCVAETAALRSPVSSAGRSELHKSSSAKQV